MARTQYFDSRDQKFKLQINLARTLLALSGKIKSYRIAEYAYRLTILDSVKTMTDKIVTLKLVLKGVLNETRESVATHQPKAKE